MKKTAFRIALYGIIFTLLTIYAYAAAPTRTYSYVAGETITASQVNTNELALYTYLQAGVDTYAANSITSTAMSNALSIPDSMLAQIATASKVSGAALTSLTSIPSWAGAIPAVNLSAVYPVGSIYISTVSTNPNTLFGFGTWTAFAEGRVLLGAGTSDATYTAGATGGATTHTLTTTELPAHTHTADVDDTDGNPGSMFDGGEGPATGTATTNSTGSGAAYNDMPPYIVVYCWQRTA